MIQGPSSASLFAVGVGRLTFHFGVRGSEKWLVGVHRDWYDGPHAWVCFGPLLHVAIW